MSIADMKAADKRAESRFQRARRVKQLKAKWVADSEMTSEQLAEIQPRLRAEFLAREGLRRGAPG